MDQTAQGLKLAIDGLLNMDEMILVVRSEHLEARIDPLLLRLAFLRDAM